MTNPEVVTHGGNARKTHAMSWTDLPPEMEQEILSHLSPLELAALSSTRKSFLEAYRKALAKQQKALCDEAVVCFGRERIMDLADVCNRFLKDGIEETELAGRVGQLDIEKVFEDALYVSLSPLRGAPMDVLVERPSRNCTGSNITLILHRREHKHGLWIALVQALLSWGLPPFHDNPRIGLGIPGGRHRITPAFMLAEIAPLLPLVAECSVEPLRRNGRERSIIKERKLAGEPGSDAKRAITLFVCLF